MVGLLGQNTSGGLLTGLLSQNRGATPEAMRRKAEEDRRRAMMAQAQAPAPERRREPGFLTYLLGGSEGMARARNAPLEREMMEQRIRAQRQLADMFGPGPATGAASAMGGQPGGAQPAPRGLPSYAEAAPALIAAELAGIDGVAGIRSTLEGLQPDIQIGPDGRPYNKNDPSVLNQTFANRTNINGFVADLNNPANEGRYFPDLEAGQTPLYDREGNVVAVRNLDGAVQAVGERERAVNDARNASTASYAGPIASATAAAQAPYQIETVQGPDGRPIVTSRANVLAQGGIAGQSPAEAIRAEGQATNEVAAVEAARVRAAASARALPTLDEMEAKLPDIIAGYGAGARLTGARALATLPLGSLNDRAERQVAATQTFQNEARQLVASILPLFGANPTEGERKYAEQMSGADVSYTPESLQEGIRLARQRAARDKAAYEALVGRSAPAPAAPQASGPIAQDAQGNRVQWNGSAWVPIR